MCDPATLAIVGAVTTVASTGVSMYGQYQKGQADKQAAEYQSAVNAQNAQIYNYNASIAEQNAAGTRSAGLEQERRQRLKTAAIIGQQKTAMAANGIDISADGTASDIVGDSQMMGEMDALMIRKDYEQQAKNYETQAYNFRSQAGTYGIQSDMYSLAGKNAAKSGLYSAAATGLGGVASVADKWYNYAKAGSSSTSALSLSNTSMFE